MFDPVLSNRVGDAYRAARGRPGAPWEIIDGHYQTVCGRLSHALTSNGLIDVAAGNAMLKEAATFFERWRDMPENQLGAAVYATMFPTTAPVLSDEHQAIALLDGLPAGVVVTLTDDFKRFRVAGKNLLTDYQRDTLHRLAPAILADLHRRADVMIVDPRKAA